MKFVKKVSLFFIYPLFMFSLGFLVGIMFHNFFYPGKQPEMQRAEIIDTKDEEWEKVEVSMQQVTINADSEYIIEEVDMKTHESTIIKKQMPEKFLGMNREKFLAAMEEYELSPPLAELERGFVSLSVESFSAQEVKIKMNYQYEEPSRHFYIRAKDHYVVVYCEDETTVYMYTGILLEELPDEIQQRVIQTIFVEDEKTLYNFLESYSS